MGFAPFPEPGRRSGWLANRSSLLLLAVCVPATLIAVLLVGAAAWSGRVGLGDAVLFIVLAALSCAAFVTFIEKIRQQDPFVVESNWGGLGGGLGGWRVSDSVVMLLVTTCLLGLLCVVSARLVPVKQAPDLLERYRPVVKLAHQRNVPVAREEVVGSKLVLMIKVPDEKTKQELWDLIHLISPNGDDIEPQIDISAPTAPHTAVH